ncbi:Ectonucleotide pyrophosphatase/phosphodiesterase family member 2-like [Homarus americanus]|uniref:Ectonucleotide pyrophosphatase/phosphodiesterase family member 2-like n=1 Tax=Homarus americanus TaxID=6706 RepID=A0A8J5MKK6_HOMAM|nr:Ectonucleotide pyrophosphatase/phosphodiesterase family member 2-like [Homarus americanus]
MASVMEELEIKEPTPSLAPSQYESPLYTKKWRIVLAVLIGVTLIGVCILGFYLSVKAREGDRTAAAISAFNASTAPPPRSSNVRWRHKSRDCLSLSDDPCPSDYEAHPLLVIGIDGLRPDSLSDDITPAMNYLARCGVTAQSLVPTYPTTTFPNMYSIATGLYPESHGIIGNEMYDPITKKNFKPTESTSKSSAWWQGEPIWNTATKQVLDWLTLPEEERPHIIMVYFEQPMLAIQEFGPNSPEARNGLEMVDKMLDEIFGSLYRRNLTHCINVILVSDHGAAQASCTSSFYLETFISDIDAKAHVYAGAVGRLRAVNGGEAAEEEILQTLSCKNPRVRALPKRLLPRRYHYTNNPRIERVILDTKPNTRVVTNSKNYCKNGEHGFNNLEPSMQAAFIGFGPDFKVNYSSHSFRNVELYNLMCKLVDITPAENNGTQGSLNHLLRHAVPVTPSDATKDLLLEEVESLPEKLPQNNKGDLETREDGTQERSCKCFVDKTEEVIPEETSLISDPDNSNITSNVSGANTTATNSSASDANDGGQSDINTSGRSAMTQAERSLLLNTHAPWGSPGFSAPDAIEGKLKVLLHTGYVIGLHETLNLGVWVSFTANNQTIIQTEKEKPYLPEGIEIKPEEIRVMDDKPLPCWEADVRLERLPQDQCQRLLTTEEYQAKNITLIQLFPEEMETEELLMSEGHLLSNMASVKVGYKEGAYTAMIKAIRFWASTKGVINVVLGPVFDYNLDGHQDEVTHVLNNVKPLLPSDYFFVVTLCGNTTSASCSSDPLDILAFVFPNTEFPDNCLMSDEEYLQYHLTTIRDVELLTGLRFFRNMYLPDALKHKTYQPLHIWPLSPSGPSPGLTLSQRIGKSEGSQFVNTNNT